MRRVTLILLTALAFAPAAVHAADLVPMKPHANPNIIEARVRCGPNARYVRGHRDRSGRYIKGRCVRTTRRR
jgi:hypothetical protein